MSLKALNEIKATGYYLKNTKMCLYFHNIYKTNLYIFIYYFLIKNNTSIIKTYTNLSLN